ncbi:MAG: class A beta-lactamase-related serine hydrolase [Bryobacteraceae bacterium]|nr:class A beta-lactamase-related serine hydrolase [Bryobacteraceae bacterium]MDW8380404.1 serine hydrolase [Bryobacterales bacterium]
MSWLLVLLLAVCAHAQPSLVELWEARTISQLERLEQSMEGLLGVAAIDLVSLRLLAYHGDTQFPQASSIKIPILVEMYRAQAEGKFRWTDEVTLSAQDVVGGSGHLKEKLAAGPLKLTWRELATAMIETSDNTATNRCIQLVGLANVNRTLDEYGLRQTRLQRIMMDTAAARRDEENISTPIEMARLVERIYQGRAVSEQASKQMLDTMRLVKAHFKKAIPQVDIASKPGGIPGVKCETGVVFLKNRPYVLSVMTAMVPESSDMVEKAAAIVHAHFEKLAASNRYGHKVE